MGNRHGQNGTYFVQASMCQIYYLSKEVKEVRNLAGPHFHIKTIFPCMGIPMLKRRRSWDRLNFNMGIPILVRRHLYMETPTLFCKVKIHIMTSMILNAYICLCLVQNWHLSINVAIILTIQSVGSRQLTHESIGHFNSKRLHICNTSNTSPPGQNGCHFADNIFK